ADALAQRIVTALADPFVINGHTVSVSCSVGVAMAPMDAIDLTQLMRCADLALYKAKADGRNCARFFTAQLDADNQDRLTLETAVRDALVNESFVLHFQPVFDTGNKTLVGFEALLRLPRSDGRGMHSPAAFIPIAEEIGLIGDIGHWVLRQACKSAMSWPDHL